jgi:hypothetical protein
VRQARWRVISKVLQDGFERSVAGTVPRAIPLESRHNGPLASCPFYPRKRAFVSALRMSALCQ